MSRRRPMSHIPPGGKYLNSKLPDGEECSIPMPRTALRSSLLTHRVTRPGAMIRENGNAMKNIRCSLRREIDAQAGADGPASDWTVYLTFESGLLAEIGRASCRERV